MTLAKQAMLLRLIQKRLWLKKKQVWFIVFLLSLAIHTYSYGNPGYGGFSFRNNFFVKMFFNDEKKRPFVSFIIPSTLRETLPRTLDSLTLQTDPDWEALVGVDLDILDPYDDFRSVTESSTASDIHNDPRIRLSMLRNSSHVSINSAGDVRNQIMSNANGEWFAFVDDDDTLDPCYIEWLKRGLDEMKSNLLNGPDVEEPNKISMPDVVVFRMWLHENHLPYKKIIQQDQVGISFAMRKEVFQDDGFKFEPSSGEDYQLLRTIHMQGRKIMLADCVGYFVKATNWDPNHRTCTNNRKTTCSFIEPHVKVSINEE